MRTVLPRNCKVPSNAGTFGKNAYCSMAEKALLPLFPLDLVVVPGETVPLHIFEPRYRNMISAAYAEDSEFGIVRQSNNQLVRVGCTAKVRDITERFEDGRFNIRAIALRRFLVRALDSSQECLYAAVEVIDDDTPAQADASKVEAMLESARRVRQITGSRESDWNANHPWLTFCIAADLPLSMDMKQKLLEVRSEVRRVELLTGYLRGVIGKRQRRSKRERLVRTNGRLRH